MSHHLRVPPGYSGRSRKLDGINDLWREQLQDSELSTMAFDRLTLYSVRRVCIKRK